MFQYTLLLQVISRVAFHNAMHIALSNERSMTTSRSQNIWDRASKKHNDNIIRLQDERTHSHASTGSEKKTLRLASRTKISSWKRYLLILRVCRRQYVGQLFQQLLNQKSKTKGCGEMFSSILLSVDNHIRRYTRPQPLFSCISQSLLLSYSVDEIVRPHYKQVEAQ
jgi:hypothetical protein